MSNALNANPIYIDTDFTGWRATQTLNTGFLPTTIQNPVQVRRQPGIHVQKIVITANGTVAAGTITVTDPNDATVLLNIPILSTQLFPIVLDEEDMGIGWRDFSVTGLTATVTKMQVWYKD